MHRISGILTLVLALTPGASLAKADIIIPGWGLGVYVQVPSSSIYVSAGFTTVLNPFVNQHAVALLPPYESTTAAAQYNFAWAEQFGQFLIQAQLQNQAHSGSYVDSIASGVITIQTTSDLAIDINAAMDYSLPAGAMAADLVVRVYDGPAHENFFVGGDSYDTFLDPPGTGTLTIQGQAVLPAGRTISLRYELSLHTYSGATGSLATGNGFVNLTISPEPATLVLLASSLFAWSRRTVRRQRAVST